MLRNSKAAMLASIELYNKPRIEYRDEAVVILLINAWELLLKAILSKNKQRIYYPKKPGQAYRTYSWGDAFNKAAEFLPATLQPLPIRRNLDLLSEYRDKSVHFYNQLDFRVLIYALLQTSIVNYRDMLMEMFVLDFASDITWILLPLGLAAPIDPVAYMKRARSSSAHTPTAVRDFVNELAVASEQVLEAGGDTGRLLTTFSVSLETTKKIDQADLIVSVSSGEAAEGSAVVRRLDPNKSHPLRQKDVVLELDGLHGTRFTSHCFQALIWKYDIKGKSQYCWQSEQGSLTLYSRDLVTFIRRLSKANYGQAIAEYGLQIRLRNRQRKAPG